MSFEFECIRTAVRTMRTSIGFFLEENVEILRVFMRKLGHIRLCVYEYVDVVCSIRRLRNHIHRNDVVFRVCV